MPTEILPGVHDVTCSETETGRIRAFLFDDGTLVDCGLPGTAGALTAGIAETGVEVERLIVTHDHRDHVGGFDEVVRTHSAETYVPEGAALDTEYEPDERYGDGDRIGPFEAVHVPGHRDHQHALVDEDRGVAVLADALSGADQRGLPQGFFHLPPAVYTDDLQQAEASLERLLEYEFDAGLVYHGSSVLSDADEKLDAYVYG
ncbi:MBL fold metallo-hydrolase [Natronomonas salina]|uniref:MBL fold metallo-hydrolase n=1 Tax=Natronomonas salina TaxID=1710540 RepID=UPI0015B6895C|nr:MBL fold metallo-hydrolase [Natronomonas salina]QLD87772.1 MBL fold metallo-hydrolase [Natronomonas salina]